MLLLISSCAVPPSRLFNPIQTFERDFPAIYDDIWLHAIDTIADDQVIKTSKYDEGLIVITPKKGSALMAGMADCGAQPFETRLEKSYTGTIAIRDIGEDQTRVNVKVDYRISTQSQIDQRIRFFQCRSTGKWEEHVLNHIQQQL